jgi:hypothetical protein
MNRLLTLASIGLFGAGLTILPLSVYAAMGPDVPAPVTAPVAGHDSKVAPAVKADTTSKDAAKPNTATSGTATSPTVPGATAKTGTTQAPATSGTPAKVGG